MTLWPHFSCHFSNDMFWHNRGQRWGLPRIHSFADTWSPMHQPLPGIGPPNFRTKVLFGLSHCQPLGGLSCHWPGIWWDTCCFWTCGLEDRLETFSGKCDQFIEGVIPMYTFIQFIPCTFLPEICKLLAAKITMDDLWWFQFINEWLLQQEAHEKYMAIYSNNICCPVSCRKFP